MYLKRIFIVILSDRRSRRVFVLRMYFEVMFFVGFWFLFMIVIYLFEES